MKTLVISYLERCHHLMSSSVNEKSSPFVTHTHKSFIISFLWLLLEMIFFFVIPLDLGAQTSYPESDNYTYKAIYLPGTDNEANPPLSNSPDGFMDRLFFTRPIYSTL